mmetsp:Transcript_61547/g.150663  ORF Transcript_61547/g.150663 Transcript_61547/m.150663 type:complete len:519 (+) Transcript_61547:352-1908(+)
MAAMTPHRQLRDDDSFLYKQRSTTRQPWNRRRRRSSATFIAICIVVMCCIISSSRAGASPSFSSFSSVASSGHGNQTINGHHHQQQLQQRKHQQRQRQLDDIPDQLLEERYNMSGPVFTYDNYSFTFDFTVSDYIEDGAADYWLYDGHNCRDGGLGADEMAANYNNTTGNETVVVQGDVDITNDVTSPLNSRLRTDLTPVGDGTGTRTMKVTIDLDGTKLQNSTVYQVGNTSGFVEFCVRFGVFNQPKTFEDAEEVNFIEVPVRLTVGLTDEFETQIDINDADLVVQLAYEDNAVEAYLCDKEQNIVSFGSAAQGEELRVCITPSKESLSQNAYIRQIEEFTFTRDSYTQVSISPSTGGAPADELTVVSCVSGATVCAFETLLSADFFRDGAGVVYGSGLAYLQIGDDVIEQSVRVRRRGRKMRGMRNSRTNSTSSTISRRRNQVARQGRSGNELLAERPTSFQLEVVVVPENGNTPEDTESLWDRNPQSASNTLIHPYQLVASSIFFGAITTILGYM